MNKLKRIIFFTFVFSGFVHAIDVGEITTQMYSNQDVIGKEITNTVDNARLVTLKIERMSSPLESGKIIPMESDNELLSTPANMILAGHAKDVFRLFYYGPKDDKERYYRLTWNDNPVVDSENSQSKKTATATTSASIGTILVIAPRKEKFAYQYKNDGVVHNTGNTSFRVVAFGPCKNDSTKETCRERYYVMPGLGVKLKFTDTTKSKTHIGI